MSFLQSVIPHSFLPPFTHSFIHFSYSFHHLLVRYLIFNINSFNASINSFIHPFKVRFHIFLFNDCAEVLLTGHQMLNCTYMRDLRTQEYVGIEEANLQPNKKIRTFVSCSCFFASLSICLLFLDAIFSSSRRRWRSLVSARLFSMATRCCSCSARIFRLSSSDIATWDARSRLPI